MNDIILQLLTPSEESLFISMADGTRARILSNTMAGWAANPTFVPGVNLVCVYTDRNVINGIRYAGVKIGDGARTIAEIPFVGDDVAILSGREWYIVTNADDTPFGVTWEKDGQTITGTLVASENTKTKIYFVPSVTVEGKDAYTEWVTISPTSGSYIWERFGTTSIDVSLFGALAYKNTASGSFTPVGSIAVNPANGQGTSYTPEGTVSTPLISVASAGTTATIKNPTKQTVAKTLQTAAPGETAPSNPITYYSVVGERLKLHQIGYTTGDSITTEDVTVKTGDASYQASTPTFSGTAKKLAFNGTAGTVTVE